jgi:hypothetical protein
VYHVLKNKKSLEDKKQEGASSSGSHATVIDWQRLWTLPVLPKMRHFLHRLAQNSMKMTLK